MPFIFLLCTTSSHRWRADVLHKSRTAWIFIGYGRGGAKKTIDPEWNPWGRNRIANFQFLLEAVDVPFVLVARRSTQAGSRQILIAVENFTYASRSIITTQMRSRNPGLGSILNEYALDSWHALRWFSPSSSSVTFSLLLIYFYWIMVAGQCRIDWILFLNLPFFITRDTCSVFRFLREKKKNCKSLLNSSNSTNKRGLINNFNELVTDILLSCRVLLHNNQSARKPVTIT